MFDINVLFVNLQVSIITDLRYMLENKYTSLTL